MKHLLILGAFALAAPVAAQTPAAKPTPKAAAPKPGTKATPKPAATPVVRTAKSLDCSKQADAKGLHGKPRKGFMSTCKKA